MQKPVVSVDRAVAHHFESLDLDYDNIAGFYDSLPYGSKPELEDCHVHFSGLALQNYRTYPQSVYFQKPVATRKMDPEAPPANVIIFAGSFMMNGSLDEMDATLRGQLRNYAQQTTIDRFLNDEEGAIERRLDVAGRLPKLGDLAYRSAALGYVFGLTSNILGAAPGLEADLAAGVLATWAQMVATKQDRTDKATKVGKELVDHWGRVREGSDRSLIGDTGLALVEAVPLEDPAKPLKRPMGRRTSRIIDYRHYRRALHPRSQP